MNIEELELSLRSEYESQLKQVLAEVRREAAEFEKKLEAEFEKHRAAMLQTLNDFIGRIPESYRMDKAFEESISEHLRLARDEGAQIAATAFGEAEKLKEETATAPRYDLLRDSISDISSKDTQAGILSALVDHAAEFAPRGAFFIVKNDHFIGWRTFGAPGTDEIVREIDFPVNSDSILALAVRSLATARCTGGDHSDDLNFLSPLGFGNPAAMVAIPLIARGRGVAVLYVDSGDSAVQPNIDALEALVRVAGLTVELLAAMQTAVPVAAAAGSFQQAEPAAYEEAQPEPAKVHESNSQPAFEPAAKAEFVPPQAAPESAEPAEFAYYEADQYRVSEAENVSSVGNVYDASVSYDVPLEREQEISKPEPAVDVQQPAEYAEYTGAVTYEDAGSPSEAIDSQSAGGDVYEIEYSEPAREQFSPPVDSGGVREFDFGSVGTPAAEEPVTKEYNEPLPAPARIEEPAVTNGSVKAATPEAQPVVEAAGEPAIARTRSSRLSDRNVDLPIEVADEERRFHNHARRFARLLVSEIKLYNEQKVIEGRQSGDLYDRLREAIDRSREVYENRVEPVVAAKFDYFHYELVHSLAEGDESKLGASYPGAKV